MEQNKVGPVEPRSYEVYFGLRAMSMLWGRRGGERASVPDLLLVVAQSWHSACVTTHPVSGGKH